MPVRRGGIDGLPRRGAAVALALAVAATGIAACRSGRDQAEQPASSSAAPESSASNNAASTPSEPATNNESSQKNAMDIRITINEQQFEATLTDSAASRDLLAQLPARIEMRDHGGVEKTGPLPSPLSLEGQPEGADPDMGDVGYYAPGNDLVLYYGDQSYYPGIVILGRLSGDAAARIADLDGSVTAQVDQIGH